MAGCVPGAGGRPGPRGRRRRAYGCRHQRHPPGRGHAPTLAASGVELTLESSPQKPPLQMTPKTALLGTRTRGQTSDCVATSLGPRIHLGRAGLRSRPLLTGTPPWFKYWGESNDMLFVAQPPLIFKKSLSSSRCEYGRLSYLEEIIFQPREFLECTECHSGSSYADEMPPRASEPRASSCGGPGLRAGLRCRLDIRGFPSPPDMSSAPPGTQTGTNPHRPQTHRLRQSLSENPGPVLAHGGQNQEQGREPEHR